MKSKHFGKSDITQMKETQSEKLRHLKSMVLSWVYAQRHLLCVDESEIQNDIKAFCDNLLNDISKP